MGEAYIARENTQLNCAEFAERKKYPAKFSRVLRLVSLAQF